MGALFQIVAYSIGNLFLGILLTVVGVILLFVLIQSWYRNSTFTPVSYIVWEESCFFSFLFSLSYSAGL